MIETCHDLSVNVANDRNFQHKSDSNHPGAVCREARSDSDALLALRAPQSLISLLRSQFCQAGGRRPVNKAVRDCRS